MSDFNLNSIGEVLSGGGVSALSERAGLEQLDIQKILSAGIPSMIAGMKANVETEEGEASLSRALTSHSKDDTSDVAAFLTGADIKDGEKILGHIFGAKQTDAIENIARESGVAPEKSLNVLSMVAPLLLSQLGNQQQAQQSNSGFSLGNLLGGLLGGGLGGGLFGNLLGGNNNASENAESDKKEGGILNALLNLFH